MKEECEVNPLHTAYWFMGEVATPEAVALSE
jgi:hypothetical protein